MISDDKPSAAAPAAQERNLRKNCGEKCAIHRTGQDAPAFAPAIRSAGEEDRDPDACAAYCPRCNGSGDEIELDGGGPDAREITINCKHCLGSGLLINAYESLVEQLKDSDRRHMAALCKMFSADVQSVEDEAHDRDNYLATQPAAIRSAGEDDALRDAIAGALGDTYVCGRVWEAWHVGTMSHDDFTPAGECEEVIQGIIDAVKSCISPTAAEPSSAGLTDLPFKNPDSPVDANELERMARERPDVCFLKGSGILKLTSGIRQLEARIRELQATPTAAEVRREALEEAAELCERATYEGLPDPEGGFIGDCGANIATAIRALASTPARSADETRREALEGKFFLLDPAGYSHPEIFATEAERDKAASDAIRDHLSGDSGWSDEVENIVCGVITHEAGKVDVRHRPQADDPEYDEWPDHSFDEICRYEMLPVQSTPATSSSEAPADEWYLQDTRSFVGNDVLWWAKDGNGYTTDVSKAQVYSRDAAFRQAAMRGTDRAWPKTYIDGKTRPAVDMQYINHADAIAAQAKERA